MITQVNVHDVDGIALRSQQLGDGCGTLEVIALGHENKKLRIVLFGESADAMRSMVRAALAVDYADKVSDAVIAAFNTYASKLSGRTPEDADPCEECLDALKQDVVNAVTEALR